MKFFIYTTFIFLLISCDSSPKKGAYTKIVSEPKSELHQQASSLFSSVNSLPNQELSAEKIALGKKLYFDKRLSKNNSISCNSCHNLSTYGVDNLATSPGDTKEFGTRNSPSVIYAHLHTSQFWDGRAKDVEEQAGMPILNPVEHAIPDSLYLENKLAQVDDYVQSFAKVYPKEGLTYTNITNAIGAFERQMSPVSQFDLYLDGDEAALNTKQKKGLQAFIDNACIACHAGVPLGGKMMQKFGLFDDYWNYTKSETIDKGLAEVTGKKSHEYMFKVPSLRNITKTSPYFHDGSVESLEESIKIMAKLQSNKDISDEDIEAIMAFFESLEADLDDSMKTL
ncbi:cytochrome-c peroxidase [Psychroflexus planctonicus]|uniref:Cytochrome-c peroxidase n=1 Tax=Psychroflexus planctonicus TaxID=1526575 RepID=A0ABQ1SBY3_9FLAO|nr:cytochrome c peroxidase [Psychroflexus planctonicus]GGE25543.1 cytochrome-c peroxidase [Psychroflexus planctonicus]